MNDGYVSCRQQHWSADRIARSAPWEPRPVAERLFQVTAQQLSGALFLDTETTGLGLGAGVLAFLVGLGRFNDARFVLTQWFLQDLPGEAELLEQLAQELVHCEVLVTFNGTLFDLPLLEGRFAMHRLPWPLARARHIDLLPWSRRLWRAEHQSCRLSHLAERLLGHLRKDDVPGAQVPDLYRYFLQTGEFSIMEPILDHNAQDIVDLAALTDLLLRRYSAEGSSSPFELAAAAKQYAAWHEHEAALSLYQRAWLKAPWGLRRRMLAGYSKSLRACGRAAEIGELWQHLAADSPWPLPDAQLSLARHAERELHHLDLALTYAQQAERELRDCQRLFGRRLPKLEAQIASTVARLLRKQERTRAKPPA